MSLVQAVLLGVLQGVTEFLPVSSSGHLVLAREFLEIREVPVLFDILLHVSTLAAIVVVFRSRIIALIVALFRREPEGGDQSVRTHRRLFLWLLVASVFTAVLGVAFSFLHIERLPRVVSVLFVCTGLILLFSKDREGTVGYETIGFRQALITGVGQGFGVLPGISRSGITISSALFSGMDREHAGEYSFLLAIPAILGALVTKLGEAEELMSVVSPIVLSAGILAGFVVGLLSLVALLRLVRQGRLYLFAFYLIPLGIVSFILI